MSEQDKPQVPKPSPFQISEQTSGQLRQMLQIVGTLLTTLGYLKPGMADTWIPVVMQIAGPISMIAGVIWSWWVNRPANLVASVVAMAADPASPVKGVVVTQTMAGRYLQQASRNIADAGPSAIVLAGTANAKALAVDSGPSDASSGGL